MLPSMEHFSPEKRLKGLGLFSLEWRSLRGSLGRPARGRQNYEGHRYSNDMELVPKGYRVK